MSVVIAVDAMSGDSGPATIAAAMESSVAADPDLSLVAFGDESVLRPLLLGIERISISDVKGVVSMSDEPLKVLRRRDTSMFKAIEAVAEKNASAAVSAGNTGALMGMARLQLKMIEGHTRPAIASFVPCNKCKSSFCILDLGANVDRDADLLVSQAYLGAALHKAVTGSKDPTVGLLNIGEEFMKGGKEIIEAHDKLAKTDLNFIGNVEPDALYEKIADVVVCDGFTGNVFLKTMEGLSGMIKGMITDAFSAGPAAKLAALASMPVLNGLKEVMDARRYNGAAFLGLRGLVVKSHGKADEVAFRSAIEFTAKQARMDLVRMIGESMGRRPQ